MPRRVSDWFDERTGWRAVWRFIADEKIPGGARMRYVFGSALLYLFVQQVFIGILLSTYYSPSTTDAWASTAYLNDRVTAGWFLRGLHHHGASAMIIVMAFHFMQVTIAGAYRKPRELNWFSGLAMAGIVLAFALTGYLLPWDQKGYWATKVATSILGSVPGGEPMQKLLQGGAEYGNLTLTRFYTLHAFVLPLMLAGLLAAHLALFRKHGVTPAELPEKELLRKTQRFFPDQLHRDVLAITVTATVLVAATLWTHGAPLFAPAAPSSNFVARPEWYFLALFQLLKYFEGPLQIVGTVVLPGLLTAVLVALPWLDRAPDRRLRARWPVLSAVAVMMSVVVTLTALAFIEDASNEEYRKGLVAARKEADWARELAKKGVAPAGGEAVFDNDPKVAVKNLFKEHCAKCHSMGGIGGSEAPDFTDYASRDWLSAFVRNPESKRFYGGTKHTVTEMDSYPPDQVSDDDLSALVEYLVSIKEDATYEPIDRALATKGKALFDEQFDCSRCHAMDPGQSGDGPNLHGHGTRPWVTRMIKNSSATDLFAENAQMPQFEKKLSEAQVRELAELIVSQRRSSKIVGQK